MIDEKNIKPKGMRGFAGLARFLSAGMTICSFFMGFVPVFFEKNVESLAILFLIVFFISAVLFGCFCFPKCLNWIKKIWFGFVGILFSKEIAELINQKTPELTKPLEGKITTLEEKVSNIEEKVSNIEKILGRYERFLFSETTSFKKWGVTDEETRRVLSMGGIDVPFRFCSHGEFMMGSPLKGEDVVKRYSSLYRSEYFANAPQHRVILTKDFYLAERLVTRGEFQRFIDDTDYKTSAESAGGAWNCLGEEGWQNVGGMNWRNPGFKQGNDHPVVCISYSDADEYVKWLNKTFSPDFAINGRKPLFRLPTEAEWEYACRAGTSTEFFWGDKENDGKGYLNALEKDASFGGVSWQCRFSFNVGYPATSPVGRFYPNPWNLYDMLGNVWEWTSDWYCDYEEGKTLQDPRGANNGSKRVLRGGGWNCDPACCRCAYRVSGASSWRDNVNGFRIAFSLSE